MWGDCHLHFLNELRHQAYLTEVSVKQTAYALVSHCPPQDFGSIHWHRAELFQPFNEFTHKTKIPKKEENIPHVPKAVKVP